MNRYLLLSPFVAIFRDFDTRLPTQNIGHLRLKSVNSPRPAKRSGSGQKPPSGQPERRSGKSAEQKFDVSRVNVRFVKLSKIKTQNLEIPADAYGQPHRETWLDFLGT